MEMGEDQRITTMLLLATLSATAIFFLSASVLGWYLHLSGEEGC